jgi:hypothetical protein
VEKSLMPLEMATNGETNILTGQIRQRRMKNVRPDNP